MDSQRMTILYFLITTGNLIKSDEDQDDLKLIVTKDQIEEWVCQQLLPSRDGFVGGPSLPRPLDHQGAVGHLASMYTALCLLIQCGDYQFEGIDKLAMLKSLRSYQNADEGYFRFLQAESEHDPRSCYCAAAILYMVTKALSKNEREQVLADPDAYAFDKEKLAAYLLDQCQGYTGGFSDQDSYESHSGYTYCALAALKLLDVKMAASDYERTIEFLAMRQQEGGFQGRCNKLQDSCYSFWVKASLRIVQSLKPDEVQFDEILKLDEEIDCAFVKECFTPHGGFAKYNFLKDHPDVLHTFYSVAALSLGRQEASIKEVEPLLAIPKESFDAFM